MSSFAIGQEYFDPGLTPVQVLLLTMASSALDVVSLQRYMDQLRVRNDTDITYPVQEECIEYVFEIVTDLVSKRGDWKNWDWKRDFGTVLSIDDLGRLRQALFTPDDFDEDRMTEAQKAASKGRENVVAYAVHVAQNLATLNHSDVHGRTLLHHVTASCSPELCRLLIVKGCNEGLQNVWGDTPLHVAASYGRDEHLKAMLSPLTKPEVKNMYFRIPYRSIPGDAVASRNNCGRMAIHMAAGACPSHKRSVSVLVRYGRADIDARVSCCLCRHSRTHYYCFSCRCHCCYQCRAIISTFDIIVLL